MSTNDPGIHSDSPDIDKGEKHTAGAFDIRNVIGGLLSVYGLILVLTGIFSDNVPEKPDSGDYNSNLIAGIALLVVGLAFVAWAKARPIVVPTDVHHDDDTSGPRH